MTIASLIDAPSELTDSSSSKTAVVLMTRIRLARNLASTPFPGWAKPARRAEIFQACREALAVTSPMKRGVSVSVDELSDLEKQ
ncbi:MAG TPA: ATP--guanido phosphotransferase, partial [Opitutus sp.]|nr:ATP--guanido phosphotransferase [Opitutus sp.]